MSSTSRSDDESREAGSALFPASFGQQRLWLLERLADGKSPYVVSAAVRIDGTVNVSALRGAFEDCIARHESLRTGFVELDGSPWQTIEPEVSLPFDTVDLSGLPESGREAEALRLAGDLAGQRFSMAQAPLLRILLVRLSAQQAILAFAVHHIVFDGWSLNVLLRDLAAFYQHRQSPAAALPPDLPIQYADFSEWQREQIEAAPASLAGYWRDRLADLAPLALPRSADVQADPHRAGTIEFQLGEELTRRTRALAQRHGATSYMVLLAAFKLALARASGQADIAVATPVAQRDRPELRDVIGYVSNTLVLRTELPAGDVGTLLARVKETTLGALAHADMPFDLLVQALAPVRGGERHPWLRAMFAIQPGEPLPDDPAGLRIVPLRLPPGAPKADLLLELTEHKDGCDAQLEYDSALLSPAVAKALADDFLSVLAQITKDPAQLPDLPTRALASPAAPPQLPKAAGKVTAGRAAQALNSAWREFFGHDPRPDDDFFAAGGHSMLAARLVARLRERLGVEIPLKIVFDTPRVGDMLAAIEVETAPAAEAPIQPISRFSALPLSFAQLRLWFMQQLEPESTAYTISGAVRIDGPLDTERLRQALQKLQLRHESLRTKFRDFEGRPLQVIVPSSPVALPIDDIAYFAGASRDTELQRIAGIEAARAFDLAEAPLLRARLVRLGDAEHALLIGLHHIVGDGVSISLLWRDVAELYRASEQGRLPELPELTVQYADYAQWQKLQLPAPEMDRLLTFWRRELDGLPDFELPTDFPRPALQNSRGSEFHFHIPGELVDRLVQLGRGQSATMFMVLLSAFQGFLAQWSGQSDIAVGVPVSTRDRAELQDVIGCFVNTLVLRCDLAGDHAFTELVERTRTRVLSAFEHRNMPFEQLVEALAPERNLSRHPLFQVLFDYQQAATPAPISDSLVVTGLGLGGQVAQFDLALYLEQEGDEKGRAIKATLAYRTDLFAAATIEHISARFLRLLSDVAENPAMAVLREGAIPEDDRRRLHEWNDTAADLGPPALLDELIAGQAAATPDAVAVRAEDGDLTFRELLDGADRLAARLQQAGAGPDGIVAVCLERGLAMPVALLAVLRAGAAYLPLDPELPSERLAFMLKDAAPIAVVTSAAFAGKIDAGAALILDAESFRHGEHSPHRLTPSEQRSEADLAYVIYTSGSTGQPKGVMVPHRGIVNRLRWMQQAYGLTPADRVLQKTPFAFDVSVWEFFWPMMTGGMLVMARPGGHRDPGYLSGVVEQHGITTMHFVPSMLESFLPYATLAQCRSLQRIFVSGEALTPELRDRYFDAGLPAGLYNLYGPTEAAVDVTAWDCAPHEHGQPVPIGRPISNLRIHVLDAMGRETRIGIPGEICIGGVGVARGYLNRPELTAERFVADPFSDDPADRLYRTGDRGRWREDGSVEYLGRLDYQVKLRGHRIELGEIEAILRQHPAVRETAAVLHGRTAASQRITAFVTLRDAATPAELTAHAQAALPPYMVPSGIIIQQALPLSLNGKLDRSRLAVIADSEPHGRAEARPAQPRNTVERRIVNVWLKVLGRDEVAIDDNFFDIGGNSLLLTQVHSRLRDLFDKPLTLVDMFRLPTVAQLADFLSDAPGTDQPSAAPEAPAAKGSGNAIAVIGMAGRFPGAADVDTLWNNLIEGRESIERIDAQALRAEGIDPAILASPDYVPATGALEGIDLFDAEFFGYGPAEAARLDPQGRLLLECAWTAFEDAGIVHSRSDIRIGVFAGGSVSSYGLGALNQGALDLDGSAAAHQMLLSNDKDYLATRISYKLGLRGPSLSVQTACSTSLVAICLAVRSLQAGECEVALAGGVSVSVPHRVGYLREDGAITSPDGHCRPFDAQAAGTVPGNGVGLVVLKRLDAAIRDGDPVRAVIRGAAITNDGSDKVGFTAPSVDGQARAIRGALEQAGVPPSSIGFIEAHGTGTPLGDQVEISALSEIFTDAGNPPLLGSLKANIGHLDSASGVAGFVKAALAVEKGVVPPVLHLRQPNPLLAGLDAPLRLNTEVATWPTPGARRFAGVSSAGMGGTNAHVILEQPPATQPATADHRPQLLPLSARSREALAARVEDLVATLKGSPPPNLAQAAWTLQSGRQALPWRLAVTADTPGEAARRLSAAALPLEPSPRGTASCHFLFPGLDAHRAAMGRTLYQREPLFRAEVDLCLAALDQPTAAAAAVRAACFGEAIASDAEAQLQRPEIAQPALFILETALARLLIGWGVRPAAMLGHDLGEFVAATLAGVFEATDAVRLIALRGRLLQRLPAGAMVQVEAAEKDLIGGLPNDISVAATDGERTVLAGPSPALQEFCARLNAEGIAHRQLSVSHALHSAAMEPAIAPLAEHLSRLVLRPPAIPFVSSVTGDWITDAEATDPSFWASQLREKVRFGDGLRTLAGQGPGVLLEVGPGRALASLARRDGLPSAIPVLPLDELDTGDQDIREVLCRLWEAGVPVNWTALHGGQPPARTRLPTYRFQRRRHWRDSTPARAQSRPSLYVPGWRRVAGLRPLPSAGDEVVVLADPAGSWAALGDCLREAGVTCRFEPSIGPEITTRLRGASSLLVWPVPSVPQIASGILPQLRRLTAALGPAAGRVRLILLTQGAEDVLGTETVDPAAAAAAAAALVLAQEHPEFQCRVLDIDPAEGEGLFSTVAREILAPSNGRLGALRHGQLWVPDHRPAEAFPAKSSANALPDRGVVLVTGAAGRFGRAAAAHLVSKYRARLVLLSRRPLDDWADVIRDLGAAPEDVLCIRGDIADPACARQAIEGAMARFGSLDGVIHAAGIVGTDAEEAIAALSEARSEATFRPKYHGVEALAAALEGHKPRFVLLCSSLSTLLGGAGMAAYAAANRAMEVEAERAGRRLNQRWVSIALDGIAFAGTQQGIGAGLPLLTPDGALALIDRVLEAGITGRVAAVAGDLERRHQAWVAEPDPGARPPFDAETGGQPAGTTSFEAGSKEHVLALWREMLGHQHVDADDDFFTLGGDSMLAISLVARLRTETGLPLSLGMAMEAPTVAAMTTLIDGLRAARAPDEAPAYAEADPALVEEGEL